MHKTLALFLFALPLAAGEIALPAGNETWITLRAGDVQVISNASAEATLDVARNLLRMREAVRQTTQLQPRSPLPAKVFLFADARGFTPYAEAILQRNVRDVTGVFRATGSAQLILLRGDAEEGISRAVFHELARHFVRNAAGNVPLWLEEGIAGYYSTFRAKGDEIHTGVPVTDHVLWLRQEPLIPLRELFAIERTSPGHHEGSRRGALYAQSWALVHYLLTGNEERRPRFSKFLGLIGGGMAADEALTSAFGMTLAQLEEELGVYVRTFSLRQPKSSREELKIAELPQAVPTTRQAVLRELDQFLARANQESAELGSGDAEEYIQLGTSIVERFPNDRPAPKAEVAKAREHFTKATQLNPRSVRAWMGLGMTYYSEGSDPRPGIAALEKAQALDPEHELVRRLLDVLREREQIHRIYEAIEHAGRGENNEALAILDRLIPEIKDAEMAKRATELRAEIAERSAVRRP